MEKETLHVLMIEDNPGDIRLVEALLDEYGRGVFNLTGKDCLKEGLEYVSGNPVDVILLDLNLPDSKGLDTFLQTHAAAPDIPVVIYSGLHDEELAMEAVKAGAQDYLVKGHPEESGIGRTLRYACERRQAEEALRESEEKYRHLFDEAQVALFRTRIDDGALIDVNQTYARMSGYTSVEECKADFHPGEAWTDPQARKDFLDMVRQYGTVTDYETQIVRGDGRHIWIRFSATIYPEQGFLEGSIQDITERKQVEEGLRASEEKYRLLVNNLEHILAVYDLQGKIIFMNNAGTRNFGLKPEDVVGRSMSELFPDTVDLFLERARQVANSGQGLEVEDELELPQGKGWFRSNIQPVRNPEGKITAVQAISYDISERKRTQLALEESEAQFREVVERANDFIIIIQDEQIQYANPQALEAFGYSLEEVSGTSLLNYVHPDEQEKLIDRYRRRLAGENVPNLYESALVNRDGSRINVEVSGGLIKYKGRPANLVIVRDITERKASEQALRESEEKYRDLVNNIAEVIFVCEPYGTVSFISPVVEHILGYEVQDITGRNFAEFIHPDDLPQAEDCHNRVLNGEETVEEFRVIAKSAQTRWIRASTRPGKREGEVLNAYGVLMDITEARQAADELRQSQEHLQAIMESARDGIVMINSQGHVLVMNKAMTELTGYSKEELIGEEVLRFVMPPDRDLVQQDINATAKENTLLPLTSYRLIAKDGQILDIEASNGLIRDTCGKPAGLVGIIRDVTERKQWEEALGRSEQRYRELIENANEAIIVAQDGMLKYVNPKTIEMTGYSYEEMTSMPFLDFIYEEDREMVTNHHLVRLAGKPVPDTYLFRMVDKLHSMRWLEISAVIIEWEGRPATLSFLSDVTSRKLAEDALKASEDKYRFVTEQIQDMISMTDINGAYLYVNEAHWKIMGYQPADMIGKQVTDYLHPDDMPALAELFSSLPLKTSTTEVRFRHKDGSWRWCEVRFSIMSYIRPDGVEELRILAVSNDITERKKLMEEKALLMASIETAYQELQQAHERLKASQAQLLHSEKLAAVGQLVAGVAHELNNPLMAVSGYATLLGLDPSEEETKEYIERINEEAMRAVGIVDNLLSFARKQEHQSRLLSLNQVIESVIKLREYELSLDNVEVFRELDLALPSVNADYQQLQQVFLNLMINSEQAINQTGNSGSIKIRTWQENGMVHASVSDTGPGIPEEVRSKVFDPFFTTKEVGEGTGLGLSICYGIIQEHQGIIQAVDASHDGAEFLIKLPAAEKNNE